jgi:hypothetical protein
MYRAYVPTQNVDAFIRHLTLKGDNVEPDKRERSGVVKLLLKNPK